jgi:hypothetical protein
MVVQNHGDEFLMASASLVEQFYKGVLTKKLGVPEDMTKVLLDDGSKTYAVMLRNIG